MPVYESGYEGISVDEAVAAALLLAGGTSGQILTKISGDDWGYGWLDPGATPGDLTAENLTLTQSLYMVNTINDTIGTIVWGGSRFIHNFTNTADAKKNVFLGVDCGNVTDILAGGFANIGIGYEALQAVTTGPYNVAIGDRALFTLTVSGSSVGIGRQAGYGATGTENVFVGGLAGNTGGSGNQNIGVGSNALSTFNAGTKNVAIGFQALKGASLAGASQSYNVGIGADTLMFLAAASTYNVAIGYQAGVELTEGSSNILIGREANAPLPVSSYKLNIGDVIFGDLTAKTVGIGTTENLNLALTVREDSNSFSPLALQNFDLGTYAMAGIECASSTSIGWVGVTSELFVIPAVKNSLLILSDSNLDSIALWSQFATPIIFGTSDEERMRISGSGVVGIGISNPEAYTPNFQLVVGSETNYGGINIRSSPTHKSFLVYSSDKVLPGLWEGWVGYDQVNDTLQFGAKRQDRVTIDENCIGIGVGTDYGIATVYNTPVHIQRDVDAFVSMRINNHDVGTSAFAGFYAQNDALFNAIFGIYGSNYSAYPLFTGSTVAVSDRTHLVLSTVGSNDPVIIGVNAIEVARFTETGLSMVGSIEGGVVFNEVGADVDFRVESALDAFALFVQGNTGYLGFGTEFPQKPLHLVAEVGTPAQLLLSNATYGTGATNGLLVGIGPTGGDAYLYNYEFGALVFGTANAERMRIDGGVLYLGDNGNTKMAQGLTINQGSASDEIISFKSNTIAHGVTGVAETDTYGYIKKLSGNLGGLGLTGLAETGITSSIRLYGISTDDDTGKSSTADAIIIVDGYKKSGVGVGDPGANANLFAVRGNSVTKFIVDQDGDSWQSGGVTALLLALPVTEAGVGGAITIDDVTFLHAYTDPGAAVTNVWLGPNAGNFTSTVAALGNIGIGHQTLKGLTTGSSNIFMGVNAGYSATTPINCVVLGATAGYNVSGSGVMAIGSNSCRDITTGSYNTGIGFSTCRYMKEGVYNIGIGYFAGAGDASNVTGGSYNVSIGVNAGLALADGASNNLMIGPSAGKLVTTGTFNVLIGVNVEPPSPTSNYKMNIGDTIFGDVNTGWVGINETVNTKMTQGLTINQGTNSDEILAFKSSDIAHGCTVITETDTYAFMQKRSDTIGGLVIKGLCESQYGLAIHGIVGGVETTKTATTTAAIMAIADYISGTSIVNMPVGSAIFGVRNRTTTVYVMDAEGDSWQAGDVEIEGDLTVNGDFHIEGVYGEIYVAGGSALQSIPTGATYTKMTPYTTNGKGINTTPDAANNKITITETGHYEFSCSINFYCGTNNTVADLAPFLNGVEQPSVHAMRKLSTGADVGSASMSGIIDVTTVPWDLDIRVRHDQGAAVNFTFVHSNVTINRIGDT